MAGALLYLYEASGMQSVVRSSGLLRLFGRLESLESLAPPAELPFFFGQIGKTFPAEGEQRLDCEQMFGDIPNCPADNDKCQKIENAQRGELPLIEEDADAFYGQVFSEPVVPDTDAENAYGGRQSCGPGWEVRQSTLGSSRAGA